MLKVVESRRKLFRGPILSSSFYCKTHRALSRSLIWGLMLSLAITACGGGGDDSSNPNAAPITDVGQDGRVAQLRFLNMIPDSPVIEMLHSGTSSQAFTELLNFGQGSNRNNFVIGDFNFNFSYVDGSGTRVILFEDTGFPVLDGFEHNFIVAGTLANPEVIRLDNPEFLVGMDDLTADVAPQIQFMHTAVGIGDIDFYLTENGANIADATPLATLGFGQDSEIFDIEETNTAQLRAFTAGSTTELLFDSGETVFARTTRALIFAINYFGPVNPGDDSGVELRRFGNIPIALGNANQPATFRVHNVISDQNAVDVYLGDITGTPTFANIEFGDRTPELLLDAAVTDIGVTSAGNSLDVLLELTGQSLFGASRNTLYLGGEGSDPDDNNETNIGATLVVESTRAIAEGVSLRLFNGSTSPNTLSVFLLRPGEDIDNTMPNSLAMGGYAGVPVVAGDFDLVIVDQTNNSTIFGPERVTPTPGTALNILIRDTFGGTTPIQIDFVTDPTQSL